MSIENIRRIKQAALLPKPPKRYSIPKISKKKAAQIKAQKENGSDDSLDLFFEAMRKRCKGKCLFCNGATTIKNDELWRIAIAHLLPKARFKSVATNESNWVELCWDCHTQFDSGKISWLLVKDSKEWETIREQLFIVLPSVAPEERKHKLFSKLLELVYGNQGK